MQFGDVVQGEQAKENTCLGLNQIDQQIPLCDISSNMWRALSISPSTVNEYISLRRCADHFLPTSPAFIVTSSASQPASIVSSTLSINPNTKERERREEGLLPCRGVVMLARVRSGSSGVGQPAWRRGRIR